MPARSRSKTPAKSPSTRGKSPGKSPAASKAAKSLRETEIIPQTKKMAIEIVKRGGEQPVAARKPGFIRRTFPDLPWAALPDALTFLRVLMIPAMIGAFYHEHPWTNWVCAILFGLASYTDYLDGYFARRWQVSTAFGAFLDPVADKLLVSACLICMSGRHGPIVAIPTAIILMREIAVSALREFMAERQIRAVVKVAFIGKLKTALSMVSIAMILLVPENMATLTSETKHLWEYLYNAGFGLFFVSTVLTVISGAQYFAAASPYLSRENTNKNSKV